MTIYSLAILNNSRLIRSWREARKRVSFFSKELRPLPCYTLFARTFVRADRPSRETRVSRVVAHRPASHLTRTKNARNGTPTFAFCPQSSNTLKTRQTSWRRPRSSLSASAPPPRACGPRAHPFHQRRVACAFGLTPASLPVWGADTESLNHFARSLVYETRAAQVEGLCP